MVYASNSSRPLTLSENTIFIGETGGLGSWRTAVAFHSRKWRRSQDAHLSQVAAKRVVETAVRLGQHFHGKRANRGGAGKSGARQCVNYFRPGPSDLTLYKQSLAFEPIKPGSAWNSQFS